MPISCHVRNANFEIEFILKPFMQSTGKLDSIFISILAISGKVLTDWFTQWYWLHSLLTCMLCMLSSRLSSIQVRKLHLASSMKIRLWVRNFKFVKRVSDFRGKLLLHPLNSQCPLLTINSPSWHHCMVSMVASLRWMNLSNIRGQLLLSQIDWMCSTKRGTSWLEARCYSKCISSFLLSFSQTSLRPFQTKIRLHIPLVQNRHGYFMLVYHSPVRADTTYVGQL